jgi:hypothetical protein
MPDASPYALLLAFPDQSPSFTHGFTCGRIWQQMAVGQLHLNFAIEETVLAETRPTIEAMAMAKGWVEEFTDIGDGWLNVRLVSPGRDHL